MGELTGISEGLADFRIQFSSPLDTIGVSAFPLDTEGVPLDAVQGVFATGGMGGDSTFFVVGPGQLSTKESRFLANCFRTFGVDLALDPGAFLSGGIPCFLL